MKKLFILSIMVLAIFAMTALFVNAGEGCSASKDASAKVTKISDKAAACATSCTPDQVAACAKAKGISAEECAKACATGKFAKQTISIKGMTCGSCENSVTTALKGVKGVNHVLSVSHKDGTAIVCVEKAACKNDMLIKAVTGKGYKAEMMNAVAKTGTASAAAGCSKTCSPAEKAACTSKAKDAEKKDKSDGTL